MNFKGQVSFEVLIGASVLLVFFAGIVVYSNYQNILIEEENIFLNEKKDCLSLSQVLNEVKLKNISWQGKLDKNYSIRNNTILINFSENSEENFLGTFCSTINTNTNFDLTKGNWRISYDGNFVFEEVN